MKTKHVMTAFAAATLLLSACSKEEVSDTGKDWDGRLRISSNVSTLTRATYDLDTKIGNGETVWLYIDKASNNDLEYGKELTANGSNGFTGGGNMFFPAGETSINLYAIHINNTAGTVEASAYPSGELTHSVMADQTTSANYAKSDLLYSKSSKTQEAVKTADGAIALPFTHLLSKIEVVLKKGDGMDGIEISKVEILNTQPNAKFTPNKDTDVADVTVAADGVAAAIEIGTAVTTNPDSPVLNEAIIVPQTVAAETGFIQITLDNGGVLVYKTPAGGGVTFSKGTKSRYTITANLTGLTVTSEVADWGAGTDVDNGSATM